MKEDSLVNSKTPEKIADYSIQDTHIQKIYDSIDDWCDKFLKHNETDEERVGKLEAAKLRLKFFDYVSTFSKNKIEKYPSLIELFEDRFIPLHQLGRVEVLKEFSFTSREIFAHVDLFSFNFSYDLSGKILQEYYENFPKWWELTIEDHEHTQKELREHFKEDVNFNESRCLCSDCVHIYRTRLREAVYDRLSALIKNSEEKLQDQILERKINDISNLVQNIKREIERSLYQIRFSLKRSSLNKLESDLKNVFQMHFSNTSSLSRVYQEKIKAFLNGILADEKLGLQYLSEDDYERFFKLLNTNIWRVATFLRKEFLSFIQSLITLRRKDISSTILRDYLGQFWVHSEARRFKRKIIYHMGPTNSGKTYQAIQSLCEAKTGCYLAPLRLLASELYDTMNQKGTVTTLLTGEEIIEREGATHYSSTIEMARLRETFDCCVIDEIQMISDPQRGWAWTRALVNICSPVIHLCGDGSAINLVQDILKLTGDELEIKTYQRMTELKVEERFIQLKDLQRSDAIIVFSRRNALKFKAECEKLNFKVSIIYGMLSPEVRREQARKFDEGETDIIVSTDAIAMGMNLPVRRIIFSSFCKFIDGKDHPLSMSDIKQISGRAGRFNRFPVGFVTCLESDVNKNGLHLLKSSLTGDLEEKILAMVGPDLDIFSSVNKALEDNNLRKLDLSEFLRLFNTMTFQRPFHCVQLSEMIEITEMVERANENALSLSMAEMFGFACAPVNLGLVDHVQYFLTIVNKFVNSQVIENDWIDAQSSNIDYLETAIKCVELFQWLARHFSEKHFQYDKIALQENKSNAIERLNHLLSEKSSKYLFNVSDRFSFDKERQRKNRFQSRDRDRNNNSNQRSSSQSTSASSGPSSGGGGSSNNNNNNKQPWKSPAKGKWSGRKRKSF